MDVIRKWMYAFGLGFAVIAIIVLFGIMYLGLQAVGLTWLWPLGLAIYIAFQVWKVAGMLVEEDKRRKAGR